MKPVCRLSLRPDPMGVVLFACIALLVPGPSWASEGDLATAEPREVGLDESPLIELAGRIRSNPKTNIHSILIVKDGKLAFEEYFSGRDEDWGKDLGVVEFDGGTLHDLRSVTKSVTSALVGIAIGEGRIPGVDANAHELFPDHREQMAPDKRSVTLHHVLTMSAGLDWFEPGDYTNQGNDEIRMSKSPDPIAFTLGRSLATRPGEVFQYNGGLPTLLGYLLEQAYGKRGDEILKEKLLEPLGIEEFEFHNTRSGLLAYASGLRLRPRDMAKIGIVYVNGGRIPTGLQAVAWAKEVEDLGAGEIVLTSMDADGTKSGYDIEMTRAVSEAVTIPVVASGGAGHPEHLREALTEGKADAALAASIFHYNEYGIPATKAYLAEHGVVVRIT